MSNIKKGAKLTVSTGNGISRHTTQNLGILEVSGPAMLDTTTDYTTNTAQLTIGATDVSGVLKLGINTDGNTFIDAIKLGNHTDIIMQKYGGDVIIGSGASSIAKVGIRTNAPDSTFHINSTDGLIIPVGTNGERPNPAYNGMIRYNTTTSQFEGYGPGSAWGSLGGVKDVDGDTYILAESSAGADNDDLQFFTAGQERMSINSVGDISTNYDITTDTGYPYYQSLGTEKIVNPPSTTRTVHGVNITAMNKRTRASYASAEACVETWTARSSASETKSWRSVCWSPELSIFVAVAYTGTNQVMTSPDGITWTARSSASEANDWQSVCWSPELSIFVAVAYGGGTNRVMTSPDGITWTARSSASDANSWLSVCWSPELSIFVAVAYTGTNRVMTSPDGITWTARSASAASYWQSVCWSPELSIFVAVANSGTTRVMTSPDGITWTARSASAANGWHSVCWSPELSIFVAVANSGTNRVMTSPDGITWTARSSASEANYWISVCWSPELSIFVAVAYSGGTNRVMTSPDGITWTARSSTSEANGWYSVCWSPELSIFVAVAYTGTNRVMTSNIGMPNSKSVVKALPTQMSVLPNGNVGIGTSSPSNFLTVRTNTTMNGIRLENTSYTLGLIGATPSNFGIFELYGNNSTNIHIDAYDKSYFNAGNVGIGTTSPDSKLHVNGNITIDGDITTGTGYPYYQSLGTENIVNPPSTTRTVHGVNITAMNKRTRASYASAEACVETWTSRSSASEANNWQSVCWSPELSIFVAVAYGGTNRVMTSPDGITWTARSSASEANYWMSVCWSPELSIFVAVAYSGGTNRVMTSPDGITWTARSSASDANGWLSVCWSPELSIFVAVAYSGTNRVMTSPDGITWTARSSATEANGWLSVCWSPELSIFVAVAYSGTNRVMTSPDGITWTARSSATEANDWYSVCWSPELSIFVAVAAAGTNRVMTSPDGITWTARSSASEANDWRSVCWSPELSIFVAVSYNGGTNRVMTSPDGITWTARSSASEANAWRSVCWSPELSIFVAVAYTGTNRVMTSNIGMPNSKSVVKALPTQMSVLPNGNVGIGTTFAEEKLVVDGNMRLLGDLNVETLSAGYDFGSRTKILASDAAANDYFGSSVAISGNYAIVGAYTNDDVPSNSGSAYIFNVSTGTELHKLVASDAAANDLFGISVAISGNYAIVGARFNDDGSADSGSAYIFNVSTGTELHKLVAGDAAANDQFGTSVAISGNYAIVGARYKGNYSGSAYIFNVSTGTQLHKLVASDAAGSDYFGSSVAISGNYAIVGAYTNDYSGTDSGSAYIFNVSTGTELHKLVASDAAANDLFGISVAISGNYAIVGAYTNDDGGTGSGSAYIFNVSTGTELHKLVASDAAANDYFGYSVAISGNYAIVGAYGDDDVPSDSGSAYIFNVSTGTQVQKLLASDAAASDLFGISVAISGNYAIVGAQSDDDGGTDSGSAYIFAPSFHVTESGNVGIGTTSPAELLHCKGTLSLYTNEITGLDSATGHQAGDSNIIFACNNYYSTAASRESNGLIWKALTQSGGIYNYNKTTAGIYFTPEANWFRGALTFHTNSTTTATGASTERMRISNTGYTTFTNDSTWQSSVSNVNTSNGNNWQWLVGGSANSTGIADSMSFYYAGTTGTIGNKIVIKKTGRVGIGTATPDCPLHITRTDSVYVPVGRAYFYNYEQANSAVNRALAIHAEGIIWSSNLGFIATNSDRRIKKNIVDVPDNLALEMVRNIPCRYYEYKDTLYAGTDKTIGFIAQEVKEILPMAISIQTSIIPNEMRKLENVSWEQIENTYKLITDLADVSGVKYRFYVSNDVSGNEERKEIIGNSDNTFTFDSSYNNVFIYGKEVNDFHTLDKQKIFTLHHSAIQEIDRIQQQHIIDISNAQATIQTLQTDLSTANTTIQTLQTDLSTANTTIQSQATTIQQHETTIQQQQQQIADILSRLENLEATA